MITPDRVNCLTTSRIAVPLDQRLIEGRKRRNYGSTALGRVWDGIKSVGKKVLYGSKSASKKILSGAKTKGGIISAAKSAGGVPREQSRPCEWPEPSSLELHEEFNDYQYTTSETTDVIRRYVERFR